MEKAQKIVSACMKEKNLSQRKLAERMGEDVRHLNQQLVRQKDMKVERFAEVLEHAGYKVEIVENDGIQKVCKEFANQIIENGEPLGKFYTFSDGVYTGIDNKDGYAWCEDFRSFEKCMNWLRNSACMDTEEQLD